MEDVLEVYQRQYADNEVLVCLDETSKQQVKETRQPRPAQPGAVGSYDYEYERNGVSNLFIVRTLEGWRSGRIDRLRWDKSHPSDGSPAQIKTLPPMPGPSPGSKNSREAAVTQSRGHKSRLALYHRRARIK